MSIAQLNTGLPHHTVPQYNLHTSRDGDSLRNRLGCAVRVDVGIDSLRVIEVSLKLSSML